MNESDWGIDLSPLDPEQDPDRLDRVVSGVLQRLGPGIVDEAPSLVLLVAQSYARRFRPLLAAASMVAIVAGFLLAGRESPSQSEQAQTMGLELPMEWALWTTTGTPPSTEELLLTMVGEDR